MRVSTIHLRALIEAFETHGRRGSELLAASGMSTELLTDSYTWIEIETFDGCMRAASELTANLAFGLHWGERSAMQHFDVLPALVASASNLRTGVECLLQFQEILGDRPEFAFEERAGHACFSFKPFAVSVDGARIRADFAASAFERLLKHIGAAEAQIAYVAFEHERPDYACEYERIFAGTRVRFQQERCAIEFDRALLDKPLLLQNPVLHHSLRQQASSVSSLVLARTTLHERIQQRLRLALPEQLEMPWVARAFGLSERSLRRQLETEGYTYKALVEQTKQHLALELLSDHARPLKDIAAQLGFANARTFHRAFRRWTGFTPAAYRAQRLRAG